MTVNMPGVLVVCLGAAIGACCRWRLGVHLNARFPLIPLGTLAANLGGGLLIGVVTQLLATHATVALEVRLALTTGFLGGLTTFSTFSAEIVDLLNREEYAWAATAGVAHVAGSLLLTLIGFGVGQWLWGGSLP